MLFKQQILYCLIHYFQLKNIFFTITSLKTNYNCKINYMYRPTSYLLTSIPGKENFLTSCSLFLTKELSFSESSN